MENINIKFTQITHYQLFTTIYKQKELSYHRADRPKFPWSNNGHKGLAPPSQRQGKLLSPSSQVCHHKNYCIGRKIHQTNRINNYSFFSLQSRSVCDSICNTTLVLLDLLWRRSPPSSVWRQDVPEKYFLFTTFLSDFLIFISLITPSVPSFPCSFDLHLTKSSSKK